MSEAYPEYGKFTYKFLGRLYDILERRGISRAIGEEQPVRLHLQDLFRCRGGRHYRDAAIVLRKFFQLVILYAAVDGYYLVSALGIPFELLRVDDLFYKVAADQARRGLRLFDKLLLVSLRGG